MPNILDDEAEPEFESCGRSDPHEAHDWSSQVLDREGPDWFVLFHCPGRDIDAAEGE